MALSCTPPMQAGGPSGRLSLHGMVGRYRRPQRWSEPQKSPPVPHCYSCANIQHLTGSQLLAQAMGMSTMSKAPAPSFRHLWRLQCSGEEHAPSWGWKASTQKAGVHTANWHSPLCCFGARMELASKEKQIKCPKLIISKEHDQNQDLCLPEK